MRTLHDTLIEGQEIVVSDKVEGAYTSLGPNLELRNCTIILSISARALTLAAPRLISCTVHAKRTLQATRWYDAYLQGCRFRGSYVGNDFGHWPAYFNPQGGLVDAEFSEATLNACQFVNVDTETVAFPLWPCFTILHPRQREEEFKRIDWPYRWRVFAEAYSEAPSEATAVTGYAPYLVKRYGGTEEELRVFLGQLGGILL